ncbi:MAG: hypothetical protein LKE39_05675 [Sphaerochaeta sp.]|jgi:hypothetical protein|nr:hypothetical protein [Sphaerochaeta sp.]MCH3919951.1 hypothetical protein [Sphaerochaeta sp.]MCI2045582.1 hypothetical protein [Sphaerochaeta sp.]MCI2076854.1 hypothetical protein [Sphaerochaeta sp.]MCI2097609.1 hypothetical protein [Sphaerochaeta sp.]
MYQRRNELVFGFHGCDKEVCDKIIQSNQVQLRPSVNEYDWLGHGMYFWEYNEQRALEWARNAKAHPNNKEQKIHEPAVLGAVICLGECLDFLESSNLMLLKTAHAIFMENASKQNLPIPENKCNGLVRYLDCAVIETLIKLKEEQTKKHYYDSVRGVFFEGDSLYPTAGFREKNHIQICIRNPNCIKAYFLPRIDVDSYPPV